MKQQTNVGTNIARHIIILLSLLALTGCAARQPPAVSPVMRAAPAIKQPNIIVIVADDLGYADISAYGNRIPTPNIDRIGAEGIKFTDAYAAAPVCSPSRAGLQTGRYPDRFGFEFNNGPPARDIKLNLGLDANEITLGQGLKAVGYRTGTIGKWHLGSNDDFYPTQRGYDEFVGVLTGATQYIDVTLPGVQVANAPGQSLEPKPHRSEHSRMFEGAERKVIDNEREYATEYFGRRAVEYVERNSRSAAPYLLYLPFTAPHDPLVVTQKYYDRFPNIEQRDERIYAAMVSALDDAVGAVLDAVERSGEADNTLIYFTSDNGCAAYIGNICSCEPLRGGKLSHFEGGMRVPLLVRWPARLAPGQVERRVVSLMDIFTTSMVAGGAALATDRVYDGVDLMPYLTGTKNGEPHEVLMWRRSPMLSIRRGDWKLWKSLTGEFTLLFNLRDDPNETRNLAESEPDRVQALSREVEAWSTQLSEPRWPSRPAKHWAACGAEFTLPI
ncbi:MAG TPA: sulfatase-like hydrolase/transferase [Steroidobacter sp.]